MSDSNRIASIDSFRGLFIILLLFINDLYPQLAQHIPITDISGITSTNAGSWMLPVFLFIAGLTIPHSIKKRLAEGQDTKTIARHIITRSVSLIIIGLIMVNSERVNAEFTGMGKNLWALLMYAGVFLVWNNYEQNDNNFFTVAGLKLVGIAIIIALVYKFKSGQFENNGSLITGWWGYLGIIGWGYLVSAFLYLLIKENLPGIIVTTLLFFLLALFARLDFFNALDPLKPIFGVITEGKVPFIILLGILSTLLINKYSNAEGSRIPTFPSIIRIIGENSLTAYIISVALYHLILATGLPILFYKQSGSLIVIALGSVVWTTLIIVLTKFLTGKGISLKV